jgi:5'-3' exonuclease
VHNCINGNDAKLHERSSKLVDFDVVWTNIMKAIDDIMHTVQPQKILLLEAFASSAKMNQQRARRFHAAKDSLMMKEQLQAQGKDARTSFTAMRSPPGQTSCSS